MLLESNISNRYNILAIDPGNNLGISILTIEDDRIVSVHTRTIVLDNHVNDDSMYRLLDRCMYLDYIVTGLMMEYQPAVVALENAFMNSRFPKSVIQLSQYVVTIELAVRRADCWCKIFKYAPKYIKSKIGAGGTADKSDMKSNLKSIQELNKLLDIDSLTEHSIDSISIGYIAYQDVVQYPHLLWMLP